jgi:hypothetical protein
MRESLKVIRSTTLIAVLFVGWNTACAPVSPKQEEELVPRELIPIGFEQKDCHYVKEEELPQSHGGGSVSFGGSTSEDLVRDKSNPGGQKHTRPFKCHADAPSPTSGSPKDRCVSHNGVLCWADAAMRG